MATSAPGRSRNALGRLRSLPVILVVLAILVFVFYQFVLGGLVQPVQTFFENWLPLTALNQCVIWATLAVGLNIVVGYAGLLDLGYVAFWAIGGYVAAWIMSPFFQQWNVNVFGSALPGQELGIHINFWLVLPIGAAFCALWGVIIGAPTLRLKSDYLALVTLGFGEIIPEVFRNGESVNGFNLTNGSKGIDPIDPIPTGPFQFLGVPANLGPFDNTWKFLVYALLAAFAIFVSLRIRVGRLGRAWLAIREDELAASMMGVPLMRTKLAAYAVGAAIGGLGGVAYATLTSGVIPDSFQFSNSIILLAMVVLGGMGNVWGVLLGALILEWINVVGLPQFGNSFNSTFGTEINFPSYNFLIFGLLLIIMMLFRREGLLPETRTRQVLQEPERTEIESVGADLEGTKV
jgi:branched-chain amino acid transport system permease protein